ncbi:hypothetical protein YW3DRAFT_07275 [Streptomyces sp. MnatMP-M77]|nr:hypothetical protein [Streptomyces sp. MnatMP-M77]SBV05950.1 hypothetical protein YW3DRAFT_07275 [Streptomyces sp. MnatMP-M77]
MDAHQPDLLEILVSLRRPGILPVALLAAALAACSAETMDADDP